MKSLLRILTILLCSLFIVQCSKGDQSTGTNAVKDGSGKPGTLQFNWPEKGEARVTEKMEMEGGDKDMKLSVIYTLKWSTKNEITTFKLSNFSFNGQLGKQKGEKMEKIIEATFGLQMYLAREFNVKNGKFNKVLNKDGMKKLAEKYAKQMGLPELPNAKIVITAAGELIKNKWLMWVSQFIGAQIDGDNIILSDSFPKNEFLEDKITIESKEGGNKLIFKHKQEAVGIKALTKLWKEKLSDKEITEMKKVINNGSVRINQKSIVNTQTLQPYYYEVITKTVMSGKDFSQKLYNTISTKFEWK